MLPLPRTRLTVACNALAAGRAPAATRRASGRATCCACTSATHRTGCGGAVCCMLCGQLLQSGCCLTAAANDLLRICQCSAQNQVRPPFHKLSKAAAPQGGISSSQRCAACSALCCNYEGVAHFRLHSLGNPTPGLEGEHDQHHYGGRRRLQGGHPAGGPARGVEVQYAAPRSSRQRLISS